MYLKLWCALGSGDKGPTLVCYHVAWPETASQTVLLLPVSLEQPGCRGPLSTLLPPVMLECFWDYKNTGAQALLPETRLSVVWHEVRIRIISVSAFKEGASGGVRETIFQQKEAIRIKQCASPMSVQVAWILQGRAPNISWPRQSLLTRQASKTCGYSQAKPLNDNFSYFWTWHDESIGPHHLPLGHFRTLF